MRNVLIPFAAILIGSIACSADPISPPPSPDAVPKGGWMSATAEGDSWDAWYVAVSEYPSGITFEGIDWPEQETSLAIRLFIRTDVGLGEQAFGSGGDAVADVMYRPTYGQPAGWTVSGTTGSGSVKLETLTDNRATGTFSFTATAISPFASPSTYRITRGSFDVRF